MDPFAVLADGDVERGSWLSGELQALYGGGLSFVRPVLFANVVQSMDGVVALPSGTSSGSVISGRNQADRFLMGLLRATADAVLIGAGTLRATPGHRWTPGHVFPPMSGAFAELRRRLGRTPDPRVVVLTARGELDPLHPAIAGGALIITTSAGAQRLPGGLPETCHVRVAGTAGTVDLRRAREILDEEGYAVILSEAGPTVTGQFVDHGLLDELFLTVSPLVAGTVTGSPAGFAGGVQFLPDRRLWADLTSVRTHGSHLFLRYRWDGSRAAPPEPPAAPSRVPGGDGSASPATSGTP